MIDSFIELKQDLPWVTVVSQSCSIRSISAQQSKTNNRFIWHSANLVTNTTANFRRKRPPIHTADGEKRLVLNDFRDKKNHAWCMVLGWARSPNTLFSPNWKNRQVVRSMSKQISPHKANLPDFYGFAYASKTQSIRPIFFGKKWWGSF